ncbi:MAG: DUF4595 domain-containing protein, partial [Sphingobacteriales bacterium]
MLHPIVLKSNTTRLKALLDKSKTALYLVASLSLFSCQENNPVHPEPAQGQTPTVAFNQARVSSTAALKKYKLTKFGNRKLMYYPDGRIKGFLDTSSGLTATYSYNYTPGTMYSSGSIDVVLYAPSPNTYNAKLTYWFNASGHCYKFQQVNHEPSGDVTLMFMLGYNPQGQLVDCLQWLNGSARGREKYAYNADGDLIKITSLNPQQVIRRTVTLSYTDANGAPPVDDLYPVGSVWTETYEAFLPYFGKHSKHLIQSVVETFSSNPNSPKHVYYSYVRNGDGYVTQRKATYKLGSEPFELPGSQAASAGERCGSRGRERSGGRVRRVG